MFDRQLFNTKLDYMTLAEMQTFKEMRESGMITYFREVPCHRCSKPILRGKIYCSKKCKEDVMGEWSWKIDLDNLVGQRFMIETTDSMYREGILTKIDWTVFSFDGTNVRYPKMFQLDGDQSNEFDVNRIKKMERVIE